MEDSLSKKWITTAVLYYCSTAMGVAETFFGPSLTDFKNALGTSIETINAIGTATEIFRVLGIFIFSFVLSYVRRETISTVLLSVLGLSLMFLPYSSDLYTFGTMMSIGAFSKGGFQAAQLIWILDIWKGSSGPFLQADHFFNAVGMIFPPLFFEPYLSQNTKLKEAATVLMKSWIISITTSTSINIAGLGFSSASNCSTLFIPSALCGGMVIFGAFLQLLLVIMQRHSKEKGGYEDLDNIEIDSSHDLSEDKRSLARTIILLAVIIVIYSSFMSAEVIDLHFFSVFLNISPLQISTQEGAQILIAAYLADIGATFTGIFLSARISSRIIVWGNIVTLFVAIVFLWVSAAYGNRTLLWVGAILVGIGLSTANPSIYHYVDSHLKLTNITGAILVIGSGFIAAAYKLVLGKFVETVPFVYIYANLIIVASAIIGMVSFRALTQDANVSK